MWGGGMIWEPNPRVTMSRLLTTDTTVSLMNVCRIMGHGPTLQLFDTLLAFRFLSSALPLLLVDPVLGFGIGAQAPLTKQLLAPPLAQRLPPPPQLVRRSETLGKIPPLPASGGECCHGQ